jgi:hypothetical protein
MRGIRKSQWRKCWCLECKSMQVSIWEYSNTQSEHLVSTYDRPTYAYTYAKVGIQAFLGPRWAYRHSYGQGGLKGILRPRMGI